MAKPFKPKIITYRLPDGAYRTPDGKRVTKNTPGAVKEVTRSKKWYGRLPDGTKVPLDENRKTAGKLLDSKRQEVRLDREGLVNPHKESLLRPLANHLQDYRRHLQLANNTEKYVQKRCRRILEVLEGCKFKTWYDVNGDDVLQFLVDRRAAADKQAATAPARRRGFGLATSNHYISAVKGFTRWMARCEPPRAPSDPLLSLKKLNARTDVRIERRALLPDQFPKLLQAARGGPVFRGLAGADREVIYALAAYTGLRCSELASLTPEHFDLDGSPATVEVEAAYSKHRERDRLLLRPDVAGLVRRYLKGKAPGKALWPSSWVQSGAEMIRRDLKAAKIPWQDVRGRVFDFHALRHQFASGLAAAGVAPGVAKDLLRHSTITLTMDVYAHLEQDAQAEALSKLPDLPQDKDKDAGGGKKARKA